MKRPISVFVILLLSMLAFAMLPPTAAEGYSIDELWTNPMQVTDVAVSKDGNYLAAVNETGLYFFGWDSPNPIWWYLNSSGDNFLSVAISADGQYVIAGNSTNGAIYYFGGCLGRTGQQPSDGYTWVSQPFIYFGPAGNNDVERRTIDISDNGEYVVVGGTGERVYYFIDCTTKSNTGVNWEWYSYTYLGLVHAVDMSPDGRYVVAGGPDWSTGMQGEVLFFIDANAGSPGLRSPTWNNHTGLGPIVDVAVSDDGYSVSAVSINLPFTLYYWAGASGMSGSVNVNANWTRLHGFSSVDMSSDGQRVVAGFTELNVASLHYWDNARTLSGTNVAETWVRVPDLSVIDVGISDDGNLILAGTGRPYSALFYTNDGTLIGNFTLDRQGIIVSMAGSGTSAAVGSVTIDTLYFFRITKTNAVGGDVLSLDGLMLLAPYLAVTLVAGAVLAGVLLRMRRRMP